MLLIGTLIGYAYAAWQAADIWFPGRSWRYDVSVALLALLVLSGWLFQDNQHKATDRPHQ